MEKNIFEKYVEQAQRSATQSRSQRLSSQYEARLSREQERYDRLEAFRIARLGSSPEDLFGPEFACYCEEFISLARKHKFKRSENIVPREPELFGLPYKAPIGAKLLKLLFRSNSPGTRDGWRGYLVGEIDTPSENRNVWKFGDRHSQSGIYLCDDVRVRTSKGLSLPSGMSPHIGEYVYSHHVHDGERGNPSGGSYPATWDYDVYTWEETPPEEYKEFFGKIVARSFVRA